MDRDRPCELASARACFEMFATLRDEIGIATGCIARDSLGDFEMSLWRQEMLCAALKRLIGSSAPGIVDSKTWECVRELAAALKTQSHGYEALIRQCGQTSAILQDLCRLYEDAKGLSKNTNFPSLVCEV